MVTLVRNRNPMYGLIVSVVLAAAQPLPAFAQESHHFEVETTDAALAIQQFGRQSGIQIFASAQQLSGKTLHEVSGTLSTDAGLEMLLAGTGLTHRYVGERTVALVKMDDPLVEPSGRTTPDGGYPGHSDWQTGALRLAQTDEAAPAQSSSVEKPGEQGSRKTALQLEEVVVTGSRIAQVAKDGAQPVRVYTKEQIEQSGQTTIAGFLNTLPDAALSFEEADFQQFAGQTTVALHGLPVGTTLVLLNGRRVQLASSGAFDLNNIPAAAVERIEVLPVGSAAIYGSDAIAGAVNIILRKNFDGLEANVKYGAANGTGETDANVALGRSWDRASFSVVGSYLDRSELAGSERAVVTHASLVDYCSPGNVYSLNGGNLPGLDATRAGIPAGITGTATLADFANTAGKMNTCSSENYAVLVAPTQREGALATGHFQLAPAADIFTEIMVSHESLNARTGNLLSLSGGATGSYVLSAANPYNPFGENVGISYTYPGIGRGYDRTENFIRPLLGVRGNVFGGWDYELTEFLSQDRSHIDHDNRNTAAMAAALASTDPATALNPFTSGAPASLALINSFAEPSPYEYLDRVITTQGMLRGPLLKLPSGAVDVVLGAEYDRSKISVDEPFGGVATTNTRTTYSVFGETRVPLWANHENPANGDRLAISAAVRYDNASDFGGKVTAQGGIEFRPVETLLLRSSYATSYQAPLPSELAGETAYFDYSVVDTRRGGENVDVPAEEGPNSKLKPETGDSRSFGLVYSSRALSGLEVSVTAWGVNFKNYISSPNPQDLVNYPNLFPGAVTRATPTAQDIANGYLGEITNINLSYINFGAINVSGVDVDVNYRVATRWGEFTPSLALTDTYKYESSLQPGVPAVSYVSQATLSPGFAPRLKGTLASGWKLGPFSAALDGRYLGRYDDYLGYTGTYPHELGNYWIFDANLRCAIGQWLAPSSKPASGLTLTLGGVNLLNRLPQSSYYPLGYDPYEADIRGRFLYVQLGAKW